MYALITRDLTTILKRKNLSAEQVIPRDQLNESKPYWVPIKEITVDNSTQEYTKNTVYTDIKENEVIVKTVIIDNTDYDDLRIGAINVQLDQEIYKCIKVEKNTGPMTLLMKAMVLFYAENKRPLTSSEIAEQKSILKIVEQVELLQAKAAAAISDGRHVTEINWD